MAIKSHLLDKICVNPKNIKIGKYCVNFLLIVMHKFALSVHGMLEIVAWPWCTTADNLTTIALDSCTNHELKPQCTHNRMLGI